MSSKGLSLLVLLVAIFCLGGCYGLLVEDRHGLWVNSRDKIIGTKFNLDSTHTATGHLYSYVFSEMSRFPKSGAYKVEEEGMNKRYFIRWTNFCGYSLLVAPDDTIVSWRLESSLDGCNPPS